MSKRSRVSAPWWRRPCAREDAGARQRARTRQAQLTKPPGSLGRLERLAEDLAALQGRERPRLQRVRIGVFAADHGVAAEGVSAFPQAVTAEMLRNFAAGGAAISVLARTLGAEFSVINVGTAEPVEPLPGVEDARLGAGSGDIVRTAAMSAQQCEAALALGRDWVERAPADLLIGGEMGIANSTAAAALAAALSGLPALDLVGRGTGVDADGLVRKRAAVAAALALHGPPAEPFEALCALGGLELAALAGVYLGAAQRGVPVLVDGFICTAAALAAVHLNPAVRPWLLFSHCSAEHGHRPLLEHLRAEPLLALDLRLGEASGAALTLSLLRAAVDLHNDMATFAEAGVSGAGTDG